VHLKRFEYDIEEKGVKIDNNVNIPQSLSLDTHLVRGVKEDSSYCLSGIVEHTGELDYGHYTATCRNSINGKWYDFNDSSVSENNTIFSGKAEFISS
jgi:ubiquitin C-terminal hydrolase